VLRRQVGETSQILRHLLVGRLAFTPRADGSGRFYTFEGPRSLSALLSGIVTPEGVVTPGGYSEGWNASLSFSIAGVALAA
jgi:hypothetical protein